MTVLQQFIHNNRNENKKKKRKKKQIHAEPLKSEHCAKIENDVQECLAGVLYLRRELLKCWCNFSSNFRDVFR